MESDDKKESQKRWKFHVLPSSKSTVFTWMESTYMISPLWNWSVIKILLPPKSFLWCHGFSCYPCLNSFQKENKYKNKLILFRGYSYGIVKKQLLFSKTKIHQWRTPTSTGIATSFKGTSPHCSIHWETPTLYVRLLIETDTKCFTYFKSCNVSLRTENCFRLYQTY